MKRAAWTPSALACAGLALLAASFEGWVRSGSPPAEIHTKSFIVAVLATNLGVVGVGALLIGVVAAPVGSIASWVFWRLTRHRLAIFAQGVLLGAVIATPIRELHELRGPIPFVVGSVIGVSISYGLARVDFKLTADWGLAAKLGSALALLAVAATSLGVVRSSPVQLELATFEGTLSGRVVGTAFSPRAVTSERLDPVAGTAAGLGTLAAGTDKLTPRPNLLLITVEGLRSDHVTLGARREALPQLESLAKRGVVFSRAYVPTPTCAPSLATILTGEPPHVHGVWHDSQRPSVDGLFETLSATHDTAAFFIGRAAISGLVGAALSVSSSEALEAKPVLEWLNRARTKPAFLWVHVGAEGLTAPTADFDRFRSPSDSAPYVSIPAYVVEASGRADRGRARDVYASKLLAIDSVLGEIFQRLESADQWASTVAIVTSDHGFGLGEHERYGFGFTLQEEEVRVPLVFAGGRIAGFPPVAKSTEVRRGRSSNVLVSLMDVAPTIVELAGAPPTRSSGRSLLAALQGGAVEPYSWLPALIPAERDGAPKAVAAIAAKEKMIRRGRSVLVFDLARDPSEENNVRGVRASRDERLASWLVAWPGTWASGAEVGRVDPRFSELR